MLFIISTVSNLMALQLHPKHLMVPKENLCTLVMFVMIQAELICLVLEMCQQHEH